MNGRSMLKCKGCFRRNMDREYLTEKDVLFLIKSALRMFVQRHAANSAPAEHQKAADPLPSGQRVESELSAFRSHFKSSRPFLPNLHPSTQHLSRSVGHGTGTGTASSEYMTAAMGMDEAAESKSSCSRSLRASESMLESDSTTHFGLGHGATMKAVKRENDDYFVPKQYQQSASTSISSLSRVPERKARDHEDRESETVRRLRDEVASLKRDYLSMMRDYNDLQLLVSRRNEDNLAADHQLEIERLRHDQWAMERQLHSLRAELQRAQSDNVRFKSTIDRLNETLRNQEAVIQRLRHRHSANHKAQGIESMNGLLQSSDGEEDDYGQDRDREDSDDDELYVDGGGRTADRPETVK